MWHPEVTVFARCNVHGRADCVPAAALPLRGRGVCAVCVGQGGRGRGRAGSVQQHCRAFAAVTPGDNCHVPGLAVNRRQPSDLSFLRTPAAGPRSCAGRRALSSQGRGFGGTKPSYCGEGRRVPGAGNQLSANGMCTLRSPPLGLAPIRHDPHSIVYRPAHAAEIVSPRAQRPGRRAIPSRSQPATEPLVCPCSPPARGRPRPS
jgi:hypothetical protein